MSVLMFRQTHLCPDSRCGHPGIVLTSCFAGWSPYFAAAFGFAFVKSLAAARCFSSTGIACVA